ncbi:MAG: hypothetical protein BAJALOKI1v1_1000018 [Promethearchaeota archaeon]|nr:MAG: hypothetical protein BAJALOKI1v1_1000018 [Candidatus Lokiarchaeota archaeon]
MRNQQTKIIVALLIGLAIGIAGTLIGFYVYTDQNAKNFYKENETSFMPINLGNSVIYRGYFFEENTIELGWMATEKDVTFEIFSETAMLAEMLGQIDSDTDFFYLLGDNPLIYFKHIGEGGAFGFQVPQDGYYYFKIQNLPVLPAEDTFNIIFHNQNFEFLYYDI